MHGSSESGVSHDLTRPCGPWPTSWAIPAMMWCSSGVHGERQCHMCWCAAKQTADVAKDGVMVSGYGAEDTRDIRAVSYNPVGDEIIPPNAKKASLACHVECLQPARVFF